MRTGRRGRRSRRAGMTLIAALVGCFALIGALTIALQGYTHGSAALRRARDRATATLVLESQVELLRAGGFAALPPAGAQPFPAEQLRGLPGAAGSVEVAPGRTPTLRRVRLSVDWRPEGGPPGHEELVFVMSAHGMDP